MPKVINTKIIRIATLLGLIIAVFGASLFMIRTSSAQQGTGQALEISPPVITLSAEPGQTIKTRVLIRNVAQTDLIVNGESNDFVAAGESGTPRVLLEDDETSPYSMKDWIVIPESLQLAPKEIKTMELTINVPKNASPGGHYGVIRFTGTPPNLEGQGVSLSASLGSLILMTVKGDIKEELSVKEFSVSKDGKAGNFFESMPLQMVQRIANEGNVHEKPGGSITIYNMFNKPVATFSYNPSARYILPGSTRKFEETLDKDTLSGKRLFGRYTAKLTAIYGEDNKKQTTSEVTFWVIPYKLIAAVIVVLIIGFFLVRLAIRRYNRYIVNRSRR